VAGLLELARLLGERPPPSEVELVAYANEEPPFFGTPHMGSAVHARSLGPASREPEAMICLEMIGYFAPRQPWPSLLHRLFYPDDGEFIGIVGRLDDRRLARRLKRAFRGATEVPAYSLSGPRWMPDLDASDHRSYWAEGYTAVMVTDTGFIRNPHYHSPGDTAETLDYERMAGVVDGVMNAVSQRRGD
jgi:Zn-dependent M28 family amino/carboxypeptidase